MYAHAHFGIFDLVKVLPTRTSQEVNQPIRHAFTRTCASTYTHKLKHTNAQNYRKRKSKVLTNVCVHVNVLMCFVCLYLFCVRETVLSKLKSWPMIFHNFFLEEIEIVKELTHNALQTKHKFSHNTQRRCVKWSIGASAEAQRGRTWVNVGRREWNTWLQPKWRNRSGFTIVRWHIGTTLMTNTPMQRGKIGCNASKHHKNGTSPAQYCNRMNH